MYDRWNEFAGPAEICETDIFLIRRWVRGAEAVFEMTLEP